MTEKIKDFINQNQDRIDENKWEDIYTITEIGLVNTYDIGEFTSVINEAGINPLDYLDYIPHAYLASTFTSEINIPSHIKFISSFAFSNTDIKELHIPGNIKKIYAKAFHECDDLTKVIIDEGVEFLGTKAFSGCWQLQELQLPSSLRQIGEGCFMYCPYLPDEFYLPEGLETINAKAFISGRLKPMRVHIPKSVTFISPTAFNPEDILIVYSGTYGELFVKNYGYNYEVV